MTLNLALSSAVSSLLVIEKQMGVASNNIANASTAGYTRESVTVTERVAGGIGTGVTDLGIVNNVDQFLQAAVVAANTQSTQASTYNSYYQNLQAVLGQITNGATGGNDLASELSSLQSSLNQLADSPDNASLCTQAVGQLDTLCSNLRTMSQKVQQLRTQADSQIAQTVADANTQLDTIARLNKEIAQASATHQSIASLSDQRANALQALNADLGVSSYTDSSGNLQVYTTTGQPLLVGTTVNHLTHNPSNLSSTSNYQSDGKGGVSGIMVGNTDITAQIASGTLKALVQQRDTELPNVQNALNVLAQQLSTKLNNIYGLATASAPPASITGTTTGTLVAAPGTTLRVATLDSSGSVSGYADVDISGATTVTDIVNAINNKAQNATPPLAVSASLAGGALQLTSTGAAGTGVNIATLSGGLSGSAITATNPGVDVATYLGMTLPAANNLVVSGNSAATIAVQGKILANPAVNFANGNGTMAAMLSDTLLASQNFSAATATGTTVLPSATTSLGVSGTFTISGGTGPVSVSIPAAGLTDSMQDIVTAINNAAGTSGIHASLVKTGAGYQVQIETTGSQLTFSNISGNVVSSLGLSSSPLGYLASVSTTFAGFAANLTSDIAGRASDAKNDQTSKQTTLTAMQQSFSSQSGVNVDEETASLAQMQNLYAASAKVVTTVNAMFQSLLQAVGA